jgi:hypothetical protein
MFQETSRKGSDTMAATDHPLKCLVSLFINDFAALRLQRRLSSR